MQPSYLSSIDIKFSGSDLGYEVSSQMLAYIPMLVFKPHPSIPASGKKSLFLVLCGT